MDIFQAIERIPKQHILKSCKFFVKNCQDIKNLT